MKKIMLAILFIAALCFLVLPAQAQQSIVPYLPNATTAATSTNTTDGLLFNGPFPWKPDQVAVVQLTVGSTNTATGAASVFFDTSDDGVFWVANQYLVQVTANGTTAATTVARMTNTVGAQWLRVGQVGNASANAVTITNLTFNPVNR